ncbi:hypothetical protein OF846_003590 [Rhodotorula toruloides]|nr:hypothetical protein OF846_003590 [Rhodotorula toruloides]
MPGLQTFARLFPHLWTFATCSGVQVSRSIDLMREMCTPRERWMPEQRMQTKTPRQSLLKELRKQAARWGDRESRVARLRRTRSGTKSSTDLGTELRTPRRRQHNRDFGGCVLQ